MRRWLWFLGFYVAGVAVMAAIAFAIRTALI
jgi:hypothetical protein